jgi:hypothetical protein
MPKGIPIKIDAEQKTILEDWLRKEGTPRDCQ